MGILQPTPLSQREGKREGRIEPKWQLQEGLKLRLKDTTSILDTFQCLFNIDFDPCSPQNQIRP